MILQDKIEIKVNGTTVKYYKSLGYKVKNKQTIIINVEELPKSSGYKIKVKCDYCGKEKYLSYYHYLKNIKNINLYTCSNKCAYELKNKKTNLLKYGKESYSSTNEFKNKYKDTCLKKYGVNNVSKSIEIKNKISKKNKKIWRNKILKDINILSINENGIYDMLCENKKHIYKINKDLLHNRKQLNTILCTICHPPNSYTISGYEIQLHDFIKQNTKNTLTSDRKILNGKELDIYLPDLKLAFEFNGLYWHNELNKNKNYHLNKTELCKEKGIQLIHIWEDNWIYKQNVVKSMILNKLGKTPNKIYGRKTEVKEVSDNKIIKEFLIENHLQGFVGSKIKLGLYYENELVSLMIFGKRRVSMAKKTTNIDEYELLRFCNKLNINIIGGASKLFKYFIEKYNPKEIITYADRSHSDGKLYEQLGFNFVSKTSPNYYYIIDNLRKHRFNFRKDKLIKEGSNSNKTEHEIMLDRNIYRIYDSGNLKYVFNKKL